MKEIWRKFLAWKGWKACAAWWRAFLHWRGWKQFAGWKLWHLPPVLALLLCVLCGGALAWIFLTGREKTVLAYPVYVLSAYGLTVLSLGIPRLVRWFRGTVLESRWVKPLAEDGDKRFLLGLFGEQLLNLGYGLFKTVSGILLGTAWVWADGLYNLVQGIIQLGQITQHRRRLPLEQQWKSYRAAGWMVLVMHLTMTGLVFMMIHRGQAEEYPGYMIFATAAFAFYKLITAFVDVARDRKHRSPVDSSVYLLDLTQALFSLFSLQVAMLHAFDDGSINVKLVNSLTGGAVCLLVVGTGIYMLRRADRELKKMGDSHGRSL